MWVLFVSLLLVAVQTDARTTTGPKAKAERQRWPTRRPVLAPDLRVMPALGPIPFEQGERLRFKVRMLGLDAGEVMLGVGYRTRFEGHPIVPLVGWVRSSSALSAFYPIDDRLDVLVDERTFLPVQIDFVLREAGNAFSMHTRFEQERRFLETTRKRGSAKALTRNFSPAGPVFDALSSVYAARRMTLTPGQRFSYSIWDGRRERLITVHVSGFEKVWTELGFFDTVKVDLTGQITGGFIEPKDLDQPPQKGTAWIGLDPHRTPVKVVTPTRLGDAVGLLVHRGVEVAPAPPSAAP